MVSVAEHVVMMILTLVRNYMPAHKQIIKGDWNVAEIAKEYVPILAQLVDILYTMDPNLHAAYMVMSCYC